MILRRPGVKLDPSVENVRRSPHQWEVDLPIPDDLSCLEGHFKAFPVVPGVLQLDWVIRYALEWRGGEPDSFQIEGLKFKRPLLPGQCPTLTLDAYETLDHFRFRLFDEDGDFSVGRLVCTAKIDE